MAGGKQSPRQKMVNLMYLVFICMLALNMSKEVLAAFGLMDAKMEASNIKTAESNNEFFASLETKESEDKVKYGKLLRQATQIKQLSQDYYGYLDGLKTEMMATVDEKDAENYQIMDKPDFLDQKFFSGDNLAEGGVEFMKRINDYRTKVSGLVPASMKDAIEARFEVGDVKDGKVEKSDGTRQDWLHYHYEGFPLIASKTKITALQADIKATEEDALKNMLAGELTSQVSLKNFATSLSATRSAFYSGEPYDGKIIISKTDNSSTPLRAELTLDGRKLTENKDYKLEAGGVKMLISSGNAGDHEVAGILYFQQDGVEVPVEVKNSFATIPKPNTAVISADKMNVVYRGVANPITISMPGLPDNKVNARATGLTKRSGSKYILNPGKGREVKISVTGTIDGKSFPSSQTFRIKDIPRPEGTVSKQSGSIKLPRRNLEIGTVGAQLFDFDFDLNLAVSGFKFKVPGQPTISVNGNKLDSRAKSALKRAKRGDIVQIFDVNAFITNNKSYKLKKVSPVVIEITN